MNNYYTENLAEFCYRDIKMLRDILNAWIESGLPTGFCNQGIKPAMNKTSGYVFLVNEDYQVAMLNDNELQLYYTLPHSGAEGFLADLLEENNPDDLNIDDIEYLLDAATANQTELPKSWLDVKTTNINDGE